MTLHRCKECNGKGYVEEKPKVSSKLIVSLRYPIFVIGGTTNGF